MKRSELLESKMLRVTRTIISKAQKDVPKVSNWETIREWWSYFRCQIHESGILEMDIYWADYVRAESKTPIFRVFIDKTSESFLTYDRIVGTWRTATLARLPWPAYFRASAMWGSSKDCRLIQEYLGDKSDGYSAVLSFQRKIREKELEKRHRRETDRWDKDLEQVPKVPKDWSKWMRKVGIRQNFIFYEYTRKGAKTGYCTYCEKEVPIRKPDHNKEGRCSCCHHKIVYKSVGKAGTVRTPKYDMYLIQRCRDGFVIREFQGRCLYRKGFYKSPEIIASEIRRAIFDRSAKNPRAYVWDLYKNIERRWCSTPPCHPMWQGNAKGKVYGKTLPSLAKQELQYTGLPEFIRESDTSDPELYLASLSRRRIIEKLTKAGFTALADDCTDWGGVFIKILVNAEESSLNKALGINREQMKRLRAADGNTEYLQWLRHESTIGKPIPDTVISWFCSKEISTNTLNFILDKMTPLQVYNYLQRQIEENQMGSAKKVITTWRDYLSMAKRLGMNTDDEIIYRVRRLELRHAELILRSHEKDAEETAKDLKGKFPEVDKICRSIRAKYEYMGKKYAVVVPTGIKDIIQEGRYLNHCVDTHDFYLERISRRETYILFLRKMSAITVPFYTLEVEPDGTIRQKRSEYDRQYADIEDATTFLKKWQGVIAKRLDDEDRNLGEESHRLRIEGYNKLKQDGIIINRGEKQGQLLYQVLEEDLMEMEVAA